MSAPSSQSTVTNPSNYFDQLLGAIWNGNELPAVPVAGSGMIEQSDATTHEEEEEEHSLPPLEFHPISANPIAQEMETAAMKEYQLELRREQIALDTWQTQATEAVNIPLPEEIPEFDNTAIEAAIETKMKSLAHPYGNRVVFIDLEWHQLDKKPNEGEMLKETPHLLTTCHIAQICAISANYTIRFNQYVSLRKLEEEWRKLVEDYKILKYSAQDDPKIAIPFEYCMELFLEAFEEDTLFLSYGNADASSIWRLLYAEADYLPGHTPMALTQEQLQRRMAIRKRMKKKNYQWADARKWIKGSENKIPEELRGGALGTLYNNLFHKSLLLNVVNPTKTEDKKKATLDRPAIARPTPLVNQIESMSIAKFPVSLSDQTRYGLVPRAWLQVRNDRKRNQGTAQYKNIWPEFWPTKHLEPVWHVAHTDTVMLINCCAFISLYKESFKHQNKSAYETLNQPLDYDADQFRAFLDANKVEPKKQKKLLAEWKLQANLSKNANNPIYNLATCLIILTRFFRESQLALSEKAAKDIWDWYHEENTKRYRTSQLISQAVYNKACKEVFGAGNIPPSATFFKEEEETKKEQTIGPELKTSENEPPAAEQKDKRRRPGPGALDVNSLQKAQELQQRIGQQELDAQNKQKKQEKEDLAKAIAASLTQVDPAADLEKEEAEDAEAYEELKRTGVEYTFIEDSNNMPVLVQTRRNGRFEDKTKAIRDFLNETADIELRNSLLMTEHRFHYKRKIFFPMEKPKDYRGVPWFSLPTSAKQPNKLMLHTLSCRNMSDPDDPTKTRNFAELQTMLWDFDLIAKKQLYVNMDFQFCKECKKYTTIANLQSSGYAYIDQFRAQMKLNTTPKPVAPPPQPKTRPRPIQTAAERPNEEKQAEDALTPTISEVHSVASTTRSDSRLPSVGVSVVSQRQQIARSRPLTNIVSYFTIRRLQNTHSTASESNI